VSDRFANWLRQHIDERGWSVRETARRVGVSPTPISNILSGKGKPGLDVYRGLADAFQVRLEDVLRVAGELPPTVEAQRAADPLLDEGIRILTEIPPGDRPVAVRLLQGLRLTATPARPQEAAHVLEIEQKFESKETPAETATPLQDLSPQVREHIKQLADALFSAATFDEQAYMAQRLSLVADEFEALVGKGGRKGT
jgi:transcriptional regulator with XRE-family HTH domain